MTVKSLDVLECDSTYTPPNEPHISWKRCEFHTDIDAHSQYVRRGALLHLRDGRRVLATAEVVGSRRDVIDIADEVSELIGAWLPTMRHLADAVALERTADTLDHHMGQLLHHWENAHDEFAAECRDYYRDELNSAYQYEDLVRAVIPREEQMDVRLPQAAEAHSARLREQAMRLRAQAVAVMPDPRTEPLPDVPWVGPYSAREHREIRENSLDLWYADLPHQIFMGWGELGTTQWPTEERSARRDALIRWAIRLGLPKKALSEASGIARTTINRVLR